MQTKTTNKTSYDENSIQELGPIESIRTRPTMYIGNIGTEGNNHLAKEVIDNSVDEALNGYGKLIKVEISNKEGYCMVTDEGRGIPPKAIEKAFTKIHSSGKFNNNDYQTSGGLNGVGTTAVNALSKSFIVYTKRDKKLYAQKFEYGIKKSNLKVVKENVKGTGSIVKFYPDEEIMESTTFDLEYLRNELEMKSYINKGVKFQFKDVDNDKVYEYYHKNGIKEYISDLGNDKLLFDPIYFETTIDTKRNKKDVRVSVEIALSYINGETETIKSFCNSLYTSNGGEHVTGLKLALSSFINKYIIDNKLLSKKDENLTITGENIRAGLIAVVSIKHPDPLYDSQTKNKLNNTEVNGVVRTAINQYLPDWSEINPKIMKTICNKAILLARAAEAAKKAKDNVTKKGEGLFSASADITKFSNCLSKDSSEKELFIVEGRSANGTAKKCRDKYNQALYAMRGKPLNTNNKSLEQIIANKEYSDITLILTGSNNSIDNNFDLSQLKFDKVIIMSDADYDGYHIRGLLTSFFYKHMKPLVEKGHLYVAQPPLYSIKEKGNKVKYFLNQDEYDDYINDKLSSLYTFKRNDEELSLEEIKELRAKMIKYEQSLNELQSTNEINKELIDMITMYYIINKPKTKELVAYLRTIGDFKFSKISNQDIMIEGLYNQSFISTKFTNLINTINENKKYLKKNDLSSFELKIVDSSDNELPFNLINYNTIINKVTPSSRVRMKGLGEMNANELWETTMDPSRRNLIKVEINDDKLADDIMEDLMNQSRTDKRKEFITKHQNEFELI
jgi:DNA gyrase subunit B